MNECSVVSSDEQIVLDFFHGDAGFYLVTMLFLLDAPALINAP